MPHSLKRRLCNSKIVFKDFKSAHEYSTQQLQIYGEHLSIIDCPFCKNFHTIRTKIAKSNPIILGNILT